MKVGLNLAYKYYFRILGEYTSNLYPFYVTGKSINTLSIFYSTTHKLSNRLGKDTEVLDVPSNYTLNDIKLTYPEYFI